MQKKFKAKKYQDEGLYQFLNKSWNDAKPRPHECCFVQDFIIVKTNSKEQVSSISISTIDNDSKDKSSDYPTKWQKIINEFEREHDLNNTQIKKVIKEANKLDKIEKQSFEEKKKSLKNFAIQISEERNKQNIKRRFYGRYENIFKSINKEIYELDQQDWTKIIETLENLNSLIIDTIDTLKNSS